MSQGSWQVPTGGSESAVTFAGQCNTAWLALASMNSGASAPANGPGSAAVEFQLWANTSNASYPDICLYDGANWPRVGTLDTVGHNWFPQFGGGQATLAGASNMDLGATRQTTIYVTGSASIGTLGTSAQIGERKRLQFTGQCTLVNSANIVCPGGVSIVTNPGDSCEVECGGANSWNVNWYTEANVPIGGGLQVGDCVWNPSGGTRPGFVRANGLTIGNSGSNATERAAPDCSNLFSFLWNLADTESAIYTSAGVATTKGASAAADWNANKAITTIDLRGRFPGGVDGMGNSAANRITGTTATPNGTTQGAWGGAQVITLTTANLPAYTPSGSVSVSLGDPGHSHSGSTNGIYFSGGSGVAVGGPGNLQYNGASVTINGNTTGVYVSGASFSGSAQGGSSSAVNKMPPFKLGTWYQKL